MQVSLSMKRADAFSYVIFVILRLPNQRTVKITEEDLSKFNINQVSSSANVNNVKDVEGAGRGEMISDSQDYLFNDVNY